MTSGAARFGEIRWADLDFATGYHPAAAYAQSKRANTLFTVELDRRYAEDGIRAFAAHPGVAPATTAVDPPRAVLGRREVAPGRTRRAGVVPPVLAPVEDVPRHVECAVR